MTIPTLPLDVLDALCSFVPSLDLLAVAQSSSLLHPLAQRYIYRNIELSAHKHALRCLATLHAHPQLARYVKTFSLRLSSQKGNETEVSSVVVLLKDVLQCMEGMTELDLVIAPSASAVLFDGFDQSSATYPRLTHFSTNVPLDSSLCGFLQRTPAIRELQLGEEAASVATSHALPAVLSDSALPNLEFFMGSATSLVALAPGRPLTSVHLYASSSTPSSDVSGIDDAEITPEVLSALSLSTGPITVFGAFTRSLSSETVRGLANALPHLRHLRIMAMYHARTSHHPDEAFYSEVVRTLSSMPELVTAELAGIRWAPRKKTESNSIMASVRPSPPEPVVGSADTDVIASAPDDLNVADTVASDVQTDDAADDEDNLEFGLYFS